MVDVSSLDPEAADIMWSMKGARPIRQDSWTMANYKQEIRTQRSAMGLRQSHKYLYEHSLDHQAPAIESPSEPFRFWFAHSSFLSTKENLGKRVYD